MRQTLRDRKKEQTRHEIAGAALELIDRDGYGATTMAAIADAAGVSRRTVFRYFADKEEVVFADDPGHLAVIVAAVDDAPDGRAPLEVMRHVGQAFAAEPALQTRLLAKQRRWEEQITARLAARGDRAAHLTAKIGIACVQAAFDAWAADPAAAPLADRVDAAFDALPALVAG